MGRCDWRSLGCQFAEARKEVVVLELDAEEFVELRRHENQRRAGHVTDQHGLGKKVGDGPNPGAGAQQQEQPAQHGHQRRQRRRLRGIPACQRRNRAGGQQRNRDVRPHNDLPGTPEQRIDQQRDQRGVKSVLGRQSHQSGVGDDRGDHHQRIR